MTSIAPGTHTKAFLSTIDESIINLWMKLIKLGIRGNILNIIKSMYCAVKSRSNLETSKVMLLSVLWE